MRRALIATAATVAGLVALLSYKSSGSVVATSHVVVALPSSPDTSSPSSTSTGPATSDAPSASAPSTTTATPKAQTTSSFTGSLIQYQYGALQLEVTMSGTRIDNISVASESAPDPRSQQINSQAIPILTQEALAAQGVNIDVVSGASFTSEAFAEALQSALGQAGS